MKVAVKILFIILLGVYAKAIDIDEKSTDFNTLSHSFIFLDKTNTLLKEEVLEKGFIKNSEEVLGLGIVPNTALWIRFTLKNTTDKELHKILEYDNPETEDLTFYYNGKIIEDGMFHHSTFRKTVNPILNITLSPFEEKTIYIKAHCKISTLIAKVTLWNELDFIDREYRHKTYIFIFFAIILTLLLYNFMLLIFTKDVVYLYYVLYLASVVFFEAIYLGFMQLYFFSNEISIFVTKGTIGYISILLIPIILFTMEFLQTQKFPKLHLILKLYLYSLPILTLLSFDNFLFNLNIMIIFFPLALVLLYTGIYALSKGVKQARYYLAGWSFLILSLNISVYESMGGDISFIHFEYMNELAFVVEAFIFSIALAYRINILSEQKIDSDRKLIKFQQEEQELLESLVNLKTKDLRDSLDEKEVLYKELNHRVKNNLQMILSLIKLQINQTYVQSTKEELNITKDRINSIANLYEILHLRGDSDNFNTLSYFRNIVQNIEEQFEKDIDIIYLIKHDISVEDSIYCGLILNELITNSFKYAFKKSGTIKIETYTIHDNVYMIVEDDGTGFTQKENSSLGLTIVTTLIERQLHGEFVINSQEGTKTTIIWSNK